MATHKDFERDFAALCQDCYECWTKEDLQLAAELGKTLLERNKELETSLRQCQNIIDEQSQEIEYLTKQSTALRKTNDNRIRIYEQLEVSIQELERANQRLALDNSTDKKQIKSLCAYRDVLEARCEDLQKALDDARVQQTIQKEKLRRLSTSKDDGQSKEAATSTSVISQTTSMDQIPDEEEENIINQLSLKNQELKSQMSKDQRKIADLEEEISRRIQDMDMLEEELCQREEQVKSLREKMSSLEELRSENLCARCLKEVDLKMSHEHQMLFDSEEVESIGDGQSYINEVHHDGKDDNPYRTLADMYESLVKEQAENRKLSMEFSKSSPLNCLSLQEELRPFDFIGLNKQHVEEEETSNKEERKEDEQRVGKTKMFSTTAADFSEAETSSSGFSDETSNKSTQTERNLIPGSFLCSIADGDDCKFSIYDDACPIESRFRKTPEYRTLFREIFAVLKRAAEAKDQGDQLPLLTDDTPLSEVPNVPPVTPAREDVPIDFEDLQSLPESLNMSKATSETSSVIDSHLDETLKENSLEAESSTSKSVPQSSKTGRDIRLTNDILEYISIGVGVKKKAKRKCTNSPARRVKVTDLVEKIEASSQSSPNSPRKSGGRRRKEWRNYDSSQASSRNQSPAIQPHVLTTLERKETPPNSNNKTTSSWLYQPFVSTAAQEVAKLKKLEKSYAEVLKHRPVPKNYARVKGVRLLS